LLKIHQLSLSMDPGFANRYAMSIWSLATVEVKGIEGQVGLYLFIYSVI
jgi:hypothetical protein